MRTFILEILSWRSYTCLSYFDHEFTAPYLALLKRTTSVLSRGRTPYKPSAYPALLQSFNDHVERVRRLVPREQLLEFNPKQGWVPLCQFLNVSIPTGDFPHLNCTQAAIQLEKDLFWERWYWVASHIWKKIGAVFFTFMLGLWLSWTW